MPSFLPAILGAFALAAAAPLVGGCAATASSSASPAASPAASTTAIGDGTLGPGRYDLVVRGMSCPKCISNVDLQLKRIDGVANPKVDMKNGVVSVTVREGASPSRAEVARAIEDAGFTLVEIRAGAGAEVAP
jgi:copper chaperone CopZ